MKNNFIFDGVEIKTSAKGNTYATFYVRELEDDGSPIMKQSIFTTFKPEIVEKSKQLSAGEVILLDLRITQATIEDLEV